MTDFHAQLERQLVDAGRRRASQGRVRRAAAGRTRLVAAAGAVALALATGAALAPGLLSGTGPATGGGPAPTPPPPPPPTATVPLTGTQPAPSPQPLRGIAVAVLNATTRSGLARSVAELLERRGATIGTVTNATDQAAARTIVSYTDGMQAPAREVAAVLGVDEVVPFQGPSPLLGNARPAVIVMVGRDRVAP